MPARELLLRFGSAFWWQQDNYTDDSSRALEYVNLKLVEPGPFVSLPSRKLLESILDLSLSGGLRPSIAFAMEPSVMVTILLHLSVSLPAILEQASVSTYESYRSAERFDFVGVGLSGRPPHGFSVIDESSATTDRGRWGALADLMLSGTNHEHRVLAKASYDALESSDRWDYSHLTWTIENLTRILAGSYTADDLTEAMSSDVLARVILDEGAAREVLATEIVNSSPAAAEALRAHPDLSAEHGSLLGKEIASLALDRPHSWDRVFGFIGKLSSAALVNGFLRESLRRLPQLGSAAASLPSRAIRELLVFANREQVSYDAFREFIPDADLLDVAVSSDHRVPIEWRARIIAERLATDQGGIAQLTELVNAEAGLLPNLVRHAKPEDCTRLIGRLSPVRKLDLALHALHEFAPSECLGLLREAYDSYPDVRNDARWSELSQVILWRFMDFVMSTAAEDLLLCLDDTRFLWLGRDDPDGRAWYYLVDSVFACYEYPVQRATASIRVLEGFAEPGQAAVAARIMFDRCIGECISPDQEAAVLVAFGPRISEAPSIQAEWIILSALRRVLRYPEAEEVAIASLRYINTAYVVTRLIPLRDDEEFSETKLQNLARRLAAEISDDHWGYTPGRAKEEMGSAAAWWESLSRSRLRPVNEVL